MPRAPSVSRQELGIFAEAVVAALMAASSLAGSVSIRRVQLRIEEHLSGGRVTDLNDENANWIRAQCTAR